MTQLTEVDQAYIDGFERGLRAGAINAYRVMYDTFKSKSRRQAIRFIRFMWDEEYKDYLTYKDRFND